MIKSKFKSQKSKLKFKSQNFNFYLVVLPFSFLLFTFLAGCEKIEKPKNEAAPQAIPVRVMKVELKDLDEALEYVGNIKAVDEAVVYPKVSGKIIEKVKEDGAQVNKGDAIAYIDRDEVGLKFEKAPVESPIAGIIGRVYVDIGANVTAQTPVALVIDMDKVKINLDVPEKYLPRISLGQEAKISVDAYANEEFAGRITKISPVVDIATRTAPIEITVDNPNHRLNSGMFAKVKLIINKRKDVLVVLKEAVIGKEPDAYVFTVDNNKAALKKVSLGIRHGPNVEVTSGLKEGDMAVIIGQQRLRDGSWVTVETD